MADIYNPTGAAVSGAAIFLSSVMLHALRLLKAGLSSVVTLNAFSETQEPSPA